jgi:hypothetical protein
MGANYRIRSLSAVQTDSRRDCSAFDVHQVQSADRGPLWNAALLPMGVVAAFWHLLNLFAVPVGLGMLAPALAKLVWRDALRGVSWAGLALRLSLLSAGVTLAGLAVFGQDGRMATYAAMVAASALLLWWRSRGV